MFLAFFFGGLAGAAIGLVLVLLRARGASSGFFWGLALVALLTTPLSVLVQGLPSGVATPGFGPHHWVAHLLVGIALASLTLAAFIEIPSVGRREALLMERVAAPQDLAASDEERDPVAGAE